MAEEDAEKNHRSLKVRSMEKNSPQLWDKSWKKDIASVKEDIFTLAKEENSMRWQRIEKIVLEEFGSFNNLKIIEIGAGIGTYAALMAKREAKVTILDYSEGALKRAREFFKRNKLSADKFIKANALSLPPNLLDKYDISMSFGLTEHFSGTERVKINKTHLDVLKKGGITFISVPNKYNPFYRIFKFVTERIGLWEAGEEYPYSRKEFRNICQQIGITDYSFFGESIFSSFKFINPFRITRKLLKRYLNIRLKRDLDISHIKKEKGTFLDEYLSYSLILYGKK